MTCSKLSLALFLTGVFLSGCKFDQPQTGPDAASFAVDMVKLATSMTAAPASDDWPFLRRKSFSISLCFRDAATLSPIVGEKFSFVQLDFTQTQVTDASGCAAFNQAVQYNELAAEAFVALEGFVRGEGAFKGARRMRIAVNPWAGSILDLSYSPGQGVVPFAKATGALFGRDEFSPTTFFLLRTDPPFSNLVVADKASFRRVEIKSVQEHVYRVELPLSYRHRTLGGTFSVKPLEFGRFTMELMLLEERPSASGGKTQYVAGKVQSQTVSVVDGRIVVEKAHLKLSHALHPQATYEWFVKLVPINPIGGLMDYEGAISFPFADIGGTLSQQLVEYAPGTHDGRLAAASPAIPLSSAPVHVLGRSYQPELIGYSVSVEDATVSQKREPGQISYNGNEDAEVNAQLKICFKDTASTLGIAHSDFDVALVRNTGSPLEAPAHMLRRQTTPDGCLSFSSPIRFNWVGPEEYFKYFVVIRSRSPRYRQEPVAVRVAFNPWLYAKEEFFWNTSELDEEPPVAKDDAKKPATLQIASAKYELPFVHYDYELNQDTSLTRKEIFVFTLTPTLHRSFTFAKMAPAERSEGISAGTKLKLRAAFVKLSAQADDRAVVNPGRILDESLVSTFDSEVTVQAAPKSRDGNIIVAPVAIAHDFHERLLLEGFTHVYLELSPIRPGAKPPSTVTFMGVFKPLASLSAGGSPVSLRRTDISIDTLWDKLVEARGLKGRATRLKEVYEKDSRISLGKYTLTKPTEKTPFNPRRSLLGSLQGGATTTVTEIPTDGDEPTWPEAFPERLRDKKLFLHFLQGRDDFLSPRVTDAVVRSTLEVLAKNRLCPLYAPGDAKCAENPFDYATIHLLELVDTDSKEAKFPIPGEYKGYDNNAFEVRMRVFKESIETLRTYGGSNVSDGSDSGRQERVGFDKMGSGFSRFSGYVYSQRKFFATEIAQTRDIRQRDEVLFIKRLNYYQTTLQFELPVRTCMLIGPGEKHKDFDKGNGKHLICHSRKKRVGDSWYFVAGDMRPEGQTVSEVGDPDGRFLKLIRGSYLFDQFKTSLGAMAHAIHLELVPNFRMGPTEMLKIAYNHMWRGFGIHGDGGAYPGVLRVRRMPAPATKP